MGKSKMMKKPEIQALNKINFQETFCEKQLKMSETFKSICCPVFWKLVFPVRRLLNFVGIIHEYAWKVASQQITTLPMWLPIMILRKLWTSALEIGLYEKKTKTKHLSLQRELWICNGITSIDEHMVEVLNLPNVVKNWICNQNVFHEFFENWSKANDLNL